MRDLTVAAGINDVSSRRPDPKKFDNVEKTVRKIEKATDEKRIPQLVRTYFSDMSDVLQNCYSYMRPGARFVVDIGDSRFYGVHTPTDRFLSEIAVERGFAVEESNVIARRHSKDKSPLHQVELVLRKPEQGSLQGLRKVLTVGRENKGDDHVGQVTKESISTFERALPYRDQPYSKRNWGHPLHSLCSYQGKLKPAIAHWLVRTFTPAKSTVLDPLGGVGTVAFEACCLGRRGITNDLSPFAYCVASGKVMRPSGAEIERAFQKLGRAVQGGRPSTADLRSADFGLNGKVSEFFHSRTLAEVLKARRYFLGIKRPSQGDLFVKACLLHVLHGNRPYALSRTSHPITPFHPTGPTQYKSVLDHVQSRIKAMMKSELPPEFRKGVSLNGDFRKLPVRYSGAVDAIITSPPFWGMRFDRPNWLRMWFCGWEEGDFHTRSLKFLEREQVRSLDVYRDFFAVSQTLLKPGGVFILHLGKSDEHRMFEHLEQLSKEYFAVEGVVKEDVTNVERHGILDKGLTTSHNFLFLRKSAH